MRLGHFIRHRAFLAFALFATVITAAVEVESNARARSAKLRAVERAQ